MAEKVLRQVAYKVWISDLIKNEYIVQSGEWTPNYIQVGEKKVSRVNLIANVIDKQDTERLSSVVIDDGSGNVSARCFNESTKILKDISVGDTILLIGRPRKNDNETFIVVEIAKKLDNPMWLQARKKELEKDNPKSIVNDDTERGKIFNLIKTLDQGDGAPQSDVIEKSGLALDSSEKVIKELLEEGEIYQPKINRLKTIE